MVMPVGPSTNFGSTPKVAAAPKLVTAAKQFETMLLTQWLQDAESSFASVPGGDSDTDAGSDQIKGLATQQLAGSFASSGGIGISKLVLAALTKSSLNEQGGNGDAAVTAPGSSSAAAMNGALTAYKAEARR